MASSSLLRLLRLLLGLMLLASLRLLWLLCLEVSGPYLLLQSGGWLCAGLHLHMQCGASPPPRHYHNYLLRHTSGRL